MSITIKSAEDIEGMRVACRLASEVLDYIAPHIKPGITTKEIDRLGAECLGFITFLESSGVLPAPLREIVVDRAMATPGETVKGRSSRS